MFKNQYKKENDEQNKQAHRKFDHNEPSKKNFFDNNNCKNHFDNRYSKNYFEIKCSEDKFCDEENHFCDDEDENEDDDFIDSYVEDEFTMHDEEDEDEDEEHEYFSHKEKSIKCNVVIAKKHVQKIGTLIIPAPIGVGIDVKTGKLTVPVELIPCGEPVFTPKIIKDTLINEGFAPVRLIVRDMCMEPCDMREKCMESCIRKDKEFAKRFFIPFQSEIKVKGIKPDDKVEEKVELESFAVFGFPEISGQKCGAVMTKLILKVILEVKIIISRECFLPVNEKHCHNDW